VCRDFVDCKNVPWLSVFGADSMLLRFFCCLCFSLPLPAAAQEAPSRAAMPPLTDAQLQWATGRVLRVGSDPSFAPFSEITPDGMLHGIDARVLEAVSGHTGLKFTIVPYRSWGEAWNALTKGEVDLLTGCARTPDREKVALFTQPYAFPRLAIIAHRDTGHGWSVEDLAGLNLAVPLDYAPLEDIGHRVPAAQIKTCQTLEQALSLVATRKADATVMNLATAVSLLPQANYKELRVTGFYDREFPLRLAVPISQENEEHLVPVLNSALDALRHQSAGAAYADWVEQRLDEWAAHGKEVRRLRVWIAVLGGATAMAFAVGVWWMIRRRSSRLRIAPGFGAKADGGEPLLEKAFDLTSIPMLVIRSPDLIVDRNTTARAYFNGAMVLPPELSEVVARLARLPPETPTPVEWAPLGRPLAVWQARLLPLSEGRSLLTLVP
jgi:ABC-type amino acid transport substrate-binding protein